MDVVIKELENDSRQIREVQEFLFSMIKKEFGYGYIPKWHQDIMDMGKYYIYPKQNNFFIAYSETGDIIATIGIRSYDKDFPEFRNVYSKDTTSSIWRLFVNEKYRRCGLASKMFSIAEGFANDVGYSEIYLHTHKNLDGALEFWTKMGFVIVLDANDELQTVHMDKQIQKLEINNNVVDLRNSIKL